MKVVIVKPDQVSNSEVFKSDFTEFEWDGTLNALFQKLGVKAQYTIQGDELVPPKRLVMEADTCYVETEYDFESMYFYRDKVLGNQTRIFVGLKHIMENIEVPSLDELMDKIIFSKKEHLKLSADKVHAKWHGATDEY